MEHAGGRLRDVALAEALAGADPGGAGHRRVSRPPQPDDALHRLPDHGEGRLRLGRHGRGQRRPPRPRRLHRRPRAGGRRRECRRSLGRPRHPLADHGDVLQALPGLPLGAAADHCQPRAPEKTRDRRFPGDGDRGLDLSQRRAPGDADAEDDRGGAVQPPLPGRRRHRPRQGHCPRGRRRRPHGPAGAQARPRHEADRGPVAHRRVPGSPHRAGGADHQGRPRAALRADRGAGRSRPPARVGRHHREVPPDHRAGPWPRSHREDPGASGADGRRQGRRPRLRRPGAGTGPQTASFFLPLPCEARGRVLRALTPPPRRSGGAGGCGVRGDRGGERRKAAPWCSRGPGRCRPARRRPSRPPCRDT